MDIFLTRVDIVPHSDISYYGIVAANDIDTANNLAKQQYAESCKTLGVGTMQAVFDDVDAANPYLPMVTIQNRNIKITLPANKPEPAKPAHFITITTARIPHQTENILYHHIATIYAKNKQDAMRIAANHINHWAIGTFVSCAAMPLARKMAYTEILKTY